MCSERLSAATKRRFVFAGNGSSVPSALASDRTDHRFRDVVEELADGFSLPPEERNEFLPSGQQRVFNNRVGWASTYLKKAGLLDAPRRGLLHITQRRLDLLNEQPAKIDVSLLERFPEFVEFRGKGRPKNKTAKQETPIRDSETPEDALSSAYRSLRTELESGVLEEIGPVRAATGGRLHSLSAVNSVH